MKIKPCFQVRSQSCFPSAALLVLRIIVGLAFAQHGWGKMQNPFAWMPGDAGVPGIFQFLAAFSEFGGGIALILGFLTPLASLGIAFTMLVAVSFHAFLLKDPFVNMTGGSSYELALVYLGIALTFMSVGPGKLSVDAKVFGEKA